MTIVAGKDIRAEDRARIEQYLTDRGFQVHTIVGVERLVIRAVGDRRPINLCNLKSLPGVEQVIPILRPYKLASREHRPEGVSPRWSTSRTWNG